MPDHRYINYSRRYFKEWKQRVKKHLPEFVIAFYGIDGYIDYEMHVALGRVIKEINNPFYAIMGTDGKHTDCESEMCLEILLKMQVRELFSFIKSKSNEQLSKQNKTSI